MNSFLKYFTPKRNIREDMDTLTKILDDFQREQLIINENILDYIIECANFYADNKTLILVCCHIISNIALDENNATYMISNNIMKYLNSILLVHSSNHKVIWKCNSAVWNLCRPSDIQDFIPDELIENVFQALKNCCDNPKSVHTSFGALSNLALCKPNVFALIFDEEKMEMLLNIVWRFRTSPLISGHFGALVANMSVIGDIAFRCVKLNFVSVLINCVKNIRDEEGIKHVTAALHNLSDVKKFPAYLCDCKGIEALRELQINHPDGEITAFIDGIFELANLPENATTSLHAAAACCEITTILTLLKRGINVEKVDLENHTALDIALLNNNGEIAQLLIASGANINQELFEQEVMIEANHKEEMLHFINKGKAIRNRSIHTMNKVLRETHPKLCSDICNIVTRSVPGVDLLLVLQ